jgi:hypothetical protein
MVVPGTTMSSGALDLAQERLLQSRYSVDRSAGPRLAKNTTSDLPHKRLAHSTCKGTIFAHERLPVEQVPCNGPALLPVGAAARGCSNEAAPRCSGARCSGAGAQSHHRLLLLLGACVWFFLPAHSPQTRKSIPITMLLCESCAKLRSQRARQSVSGVLWKRGHR